MTYWSAHDLRCFNGRDPCKMHLRANNQGLVIDVKTGKVVGTAAKPAGA